MGLSAPGRVVTIQPDGTVVVDLPGGTRQVRVSLVTATGAPIEVGDWLLVQLNLAVARLAPHEASDLIRMLEPTVQPLAAA